MQSGFWPDRVRRLIEQLGIEYPIIQAPMAGGPSTAELVAAVSNAGGLGSLGGGYLTPERIDSDIQKVKGLTDKPFSVNLFVPEKINSLVIPEKVLKQLQKFSRELGVELPKVTLEAEFTFEEQINVVLDNDVEVFSFTFGVPEKNIIDRVREKNLTIIGTATCAHEACALEESGCGAVVAQGSEAGGHRGTFGSTQGAPMIGGLALVPQIADELQIPVIASGGIMDGRGIAASFALGASAVQMGTAFLSCEEAAVPKPWLDSISGSKDISTVLTKAFSGKYARGIKNRFIEEMSSLEDEVPSYPVQNTLTRSIRNASNDKGEADFMSLWAGQGSAMSRKRTAQELVNTLVAETNEVLKSMSSNL